MAGLAVAGASGATGDLFARGRFFIGCNYWAGHAGMYMWRDWRPEAVESEIATLAANGVEVMRVFPLWPDFQPLTRVHGFDNQPKGFLQNDRPLSNPAGVDEEMMRRFRHFCDMAGRHEIRLVVGLVTGWMSGRMFVPPAFDTSNALTDPECVMWASRFVKHFVNEMKDHPAIAAWDYGNECNCMGVASTAEFYNWMNVIGLSIRASDPSRPIVSGLHGSSTKGTDKAPIRLVSELSDIQCTHPYSFYVPGCAVDPLGTMRPTLHPTAESLLYRDIGGKPCFIEEIGGIGTCCNSESRVAAAMRATLFSAWANDLRGFLWWCNADQESLSFPPYDWISYERELGMMRADGTPKPIMKEMKAFRDFLRGLPFESLPSRRTDSVIVVPERTRGWIPAFGAYLLARQAGLDSVFAGAEHDLPEAKLYILCSGETDAENDESFTWSAYRRVFEKARRGATVLILHGSQSRIAHLRAEAGVEADFGTKSPIERTFALAAYPDRPMTCRDGWTVRLKPAGCTVLAATSDGEPALTCFASGKGRVLVCNSPIDREAIARTDAFTGKALMPYYLVFMEAKRLAGVKRVVEKADCPSVVITEHPASDGRTIVVAVNCEPEPVAFEIETEATVEAVYRGEVTGRSVRIEGNDAAVFAVRGAVSCTSHSECDILRSVKNRSGDFPVASTAFSACAHRGRVAAFAHGSYPPPPHQ